MAERSLDARGASYAWAIALGLVLALGNLWKPLTIDDTLYYIYARQIAAEPLDPYGFTVFWHQRPQPAFTVPCPPLLPYWLALALHCGADGPVLWKVWMLPFPLLFAVSLCHLLRRWAAGIERPLLALLILSPVFLPSLNLMLDIPALALALTGLAVFLRAADRDSLALALLAGVLAGLAGQTKYTGLIMPAVMAVHGFLWSRRRLALAAAGAAVAIFAAWEVFDLIAYGESHFWYQSQFYELRPRGRLQWLQHTVPMLVIAGSVGTPILLLALVALGAGPRGVVVAAATAVLAFVLVIGVVDDRPWVAVNLLTRYPLTAGHLIYAVLGGALVVAILLVILRQRGTPAGRWPVDRDTMFLALWLAIEIAGAFAMMPFPAVRRAMGTVIVATLLAGRLAARRAALPGQRRLVHAAAVASALLGLTFAVTDWYEAAAERAAVQRAADRIDAALEPGTVWYVGHWGFQFYADQRGMQAVVPGQSELKAGDWLVVPDARVDQQLLVLDQAPVVAEPPIEIVDALPMRTIIGFYATVAPLEALRGPRGKVVVYRVAADFVPTPAL